MGNVILGNLISLVAAGFMAASCLAKDNRRVFFFQFMECAILAVSSVVFGSLSAALTMALSAARNLIVSQGKLTRPLTLFFLLHSPISNLGKVKIIIEHRFNCFFGLHMMRYTHSRWAFTIHCGARFSSVPL